MSNKYPFVCGKNFFLILKKIQKNPQFLCVTFFDPKFFNIFYFTDFTSLPVFFTQMVSNPEPTYVQVFQPSLSLLRLFPSPTPLSTHKSDSTSLPESPHYHSFPFTCLSHVPHHPNTHLNPSSLTSGTT